jgi:WD40 repeat protein
MNVLIAGGLTVGMAVAGFLALQLSPRLTFGDEGLNEYGSACFSPDAKLILALSADAKDAVRGRILELWDAHTGKKLRQVDDYSFFQAIANSPYPLAFTPDGKHFLTWKDGKMVMWETATCKEVKEFPWKGFKFAITPDGKQVISVGRRFVGLYDLKSGELLKEHKWEIDKEVPNISISKDGKRFLLYSSWWDVEVWDLSKFVKTHYYYDYQPPGPDPDGAKPLPYIQTASLGITFSPDSKGLLYCSRDKEIITEVDLDTCEVKKTHDIKNVSGVYNIVFNAKGDRLLLGCTSKGRAYLYSFPECERLKTIEGFGRVQLSPDGKMALTFTKDGRMMLWDLE